MSDRPEVSAEMAYSLGLGGRELRKRFLRPDGTSVPVLAVQGCIGAGKTELLKTVISAARAKGLRVVVVREDVDSLLESGLLQAFYRADTPDLQAQIAYNLQTYVFVLRVQTALAEARAAVAESAEAHQGGILLQGAAADLVIMERSVETDRFAFVEALRGNTIPESLVSVYEQWYDMWAELVPFAPTHQLFLDPDIGTLRARVDSRHREGEVPADEAEPEVDEAEVDEAEVEPRYREGEAEEPTEAVEPEPEVEVLPEPEESKSQSGVTDEYQARLRRVHQAWLLGEHAEEFPGLKERAAASRARIWGGAGGGTGAEPALLVVNKEQAEADFREGTPGGDALAAKILEFVGL
jgi:deoxyadenosine/deoxycytidine kinase